VWRRLQAQRRGEGRGLVGMATGGRWRRGRRREGSSARGVGRGQIGQNDFGGGERGYCYSKKKFQGDFFLPVALQTPFCRVLLKETAVDSLSTPRADRFCLTIETCSWRPASWSPTKADKGVCKLMDQRRTHRVRMLMRACETQKYFFLCKFLPSILYDISCR
jgi:hypothetical protein